MVRENKQRGAFGLQVTKLHSFPKNGLAVEVNLKLFHVWYTFHIMLGVTVGPTDAELYPDN